MGADDKAIEPNGSPKEEVTEEKPIEKAQSGHTERRENFVASVGLTTEGESTLTRAQNQWKGLNPFASFVLTMHVCGAIYHLYYTRGIGRTPAANISCLT